MYQDIVNMRSYKKTPFLKNFSAFHFFHASKKKLRSFGMAISNV